MIKKSIALKAISIENLKILKNHIFFVKHQFFPLFVISVAVKVKQYLYLYFVCIASRCVLLSL